MLLTSSENPLHGSAQVRDSTLQQSRCSPNESKKLMKTKLKPHLVCLAVLCAANFAHGQGTAFTYQGRLNDGANPASGSYDLKFTIFNVDTGGVQVLDPLTNSAVGVSNGLFTVTLDFGAGVFDGAARWLEIGVRPEAAGDFATLSPRQALTASPYAIFAGTSATVAGGSRSEERRVGKECKHWCRSRWSPYH